MSRKIRSQSQRLAKFVKLGHVFFWIVRVRVIWHMFQLQFMKEKLTPDLLTLSTTFYDVSVLCDRFSKAEMRFLQSNYQLATVNLRGQTAPEVD